MQFSDLSHHNPSIVMSTYRTARDRIVLKATEAVSFTDPMFVERWQAAKAAGVKRIAYHFLRASFSGVDQWNHFWTVVRAAGFDASRDFVCLDIEDTVAPAAALKCSQDFVAAAVKAGVTRGILYSYLSYANVNHISAGSFPAGWRKLWLANYSPVVDASITIPNGWTRDQVVARQYTDQATVPGVGGTVDDSRVWNDWITTEGTTVTAPDLTSMAADAKRAADNVEKLYLYGFRAIDQEGNPAPTTVNYSIRGVNDKLSSALDHLAGIHGCLTDLVTLLTQVAGAMAPAAPVLPDPPAVPSVSAPVLPDPPEVTS